jgi:hypothetical protein
LAARAIPSRNRPPDAIENQLMVVGFAQRPFLAEITRLFSAGIDVAGEDDRDAWPVRAYPPDKGKCVLRAGGVHIGKHHVDRERAAVLREKLARLIEIRRVDDPVAAFPQIFRKRVSNENVGINNQNAG